MDISLGMTPDDTTAVVRQLLSLGEYNGKNIFKPVVAFLKVLLAMNSLDVPFTGGIGSFKLYVMVAIAFQRMRMQNSADAEITSGNLLTLFFQFFSEVRYFNKNCDLNVPSLSLSVDLGGVHRIHDCRALFQRCYDIIRSNRQSQMSSLQSSILSSLVNVKELNEVRQRAQQNASITLKRSQINRSIIVPIHSFHDWGPFPQDIAAMIARFKQSPSFDATYQTFVNRVHQYVPGMINLPPLDRIKEMRPGLHDHLVLLASASPQLRTRMLFRGTCNNPSNLDQFGSLESFEKEVNRSVTKKLKADNKKKRKRDEEIDAPWRDSGVVGYGIRISQPSKKAKVSKKVKKPVIPAVNRKKEKKVSRRKT